VPSAQALTQAASGGAVTLCSGSGGAQVMGSLQGLYNSAGASRVINIVPLGAYLDAVVPSESSSGWATFGGPGPQGQNWGFQELEAQAVAARSYVLSTPLGYGGYADTCDQTCQSYPGIVNETAVATLAVSNTAGQVMEFSGGQIATTEYSASTGGYTASSAEQSPFTPIPGSGYSCNPNHNWEVSIPVTTVQSVLPQIGSLQSIAITGRNGYGDWGGRVTTMVVSGSSGSATLTGSQFAGDFNLPSNWFTVTSNPSGGVGGYQLAAADGGIFTFGNAGYFGSMGGQHLNQPVVGMAPTNDHGGYWEVATDGGIFTFGDAGYFGSTGNIHLNAPIVGMAADPATGGYWLVASDGGIFAFNAPFYGSMGGQHLNQPIVGMAAVPGGTGYWLVSSDGGIFSFGTGAGFYGSTGNISLVQPVVGMAVAPGGNGYWLSAADGGVFTFGPGASFYGSDAGQPNVAGTVGLLPTATGGGYLDITGSGRVTNFGDAPQFGDLTTVLSSYSGHVVAGATTPG
jgi:SpoIID/LytB domain protein